MKPQKSVRRAGRAKLIVGAKLAVLLAGAGCLTSVTNSGARERWTDAERKQKEPSSMTPEPVDFVPDIPKNDPRIAKYSHQVLNVLEFGAKGDGASHPLSQSFPNQAAIDAKYGPNRYKLDDEADFVGIMEAIRMGKNCAEYRRDKRAYYVNTVYLPTGRYVVNRTIPLTDMYGFTLRGEGRMQSGISFIPATPMPLFAIERSGFLAFREFTIRSKVAARATGFHVANTSTRTGRVTYKLLFDAIDVRQLYVGVRTTGLLMTDSMNFRDCRFAEGLTMLHLQNPQGMVYNLYGCDFESSSAEPLAPFKQEDVVVFNVEGGGGITMVGGSIVHGGTTLKLSPDDTYSPDGPSASINWGNGYFNFNGVRWEQAKPGPILFDAKDDGHYRARINFENCVLYQRSKARGSAVGNLHAGMNVTVRNSMFNSGYIQEVLTPGQAKRKATLILDNNTKLKYKPSDQVNAPYRHNVKVRDEEGEAGNE